MLKQRYNAIYIYIYICNRAIPAHARKVSIFYDFFCLTPADRQTEAPFPVLRCMHPESGGVRVGEWGRKGWGGVRGGKWGEGGVMKEGEGEGVGEWLKGSLGRICSNNLTLEGRLSKCVS